MSYPFNRDCWFVMFPVTPVKLLYLCWSSADWGRLGSALVTALCALRLWSWSLSSLITGIIWPHLLLFSLCLVLFISPPRTGGFHAAVLHRALPFSSCFMFSTYISFVSFALNLFVYTIFLLNSMLLRLPPTPANLDIFCFKLECVIHLTVA